MSFGHDIPKGLRTPPLLPSLHAPAPGSFGAGFPAHPLLFQLPGLVPGLAALQAARARRCPRSHRREPGDSTGAWLKPSSQQVSDSSWGVAGSWAAGCYRQLGRPQVQSKTNLRPRNSSSKGTFSKMLMGARETLMPKDCRWWDIGRFTLCLPLFASAALPPFAVVVMFSHPSPLFDAVLAVSLPPCWRFAPVCGVNLCPGRPSIPPSSPSSPEPCGSLSPKPELGLLKVLSHEVPTESPCCSWGTAHINTQFPAENRMKQQNLKMRDALYWTIQYGRKQRGYSHGDKGLEISVAIHTHRKQ